jgi:hypothetical protein
MFGLWPKVTLPIFWAWPKLWSLFGWLPIIWHANGYLSNLWFSFLANVGQLIGNQKVNQNFG